MQPIHFKKNIKLNVFLICTGLGRINRGYESFSKECFEALKDSNEFELYLVKGGGSKTSDREKKIFNFRRNGKVANFFKIVFGLETYTIEQMSFCFFLLPLIIKKKPALIYYSDFLLGTYLWHLRKHLKLKYRLLFSNGAPNGAPFKTEDHVQQLMPLHFNEAIAKGEPASKQTLLPYGFNINITERIETIKQKELIRQKLKLPLQAKVILSVGAINKRNKRMDYLINEVALLNENYYLVILGQFDEETDDILKLAKIKLAKRQFIANLSFEQVMQYYIAADYFVLASLSEGFGRVFIEALSYGLPCLAHDCISAKQVMKEYGVYINMTKSNALAGCLQSYVDFYSKQELIEAAYNLYSWDVLKKRYVQMITKNIAIS